MGNAAFEFIVRPYKDTKVTFESRKFFNSFLAVDDKAQLSVQEMPPDCSEVQFVVRVQVSIHQAIFFYIAIFLQKLRLLCIGKE